MACRIPVTKLVIAVDAVRRGRGGPFVAAAVAYQLPTHEPLFRFTDGRGVQRSEYLLRKPGTLKPVLVSAVTSYLNKVSLATGKYCLARAKAPKDARVARLVAMYWAVHKVTDRIRHFRSEELREASVYLLVSGTEKLQSKLFARVTQFARPSEEDWRLQGARFQAFYAFPEVT